MIFAYTLVGLMLISSFLGITFGIYGYASAKLWERNAKSMSVEETENIWAINEIKRHYNWIGPRKYLTWNSETNKWYSSIHFQFLKWYDKELFRWNTKKGLW